MLRDLDQMAPDAVWLVAIAVCWPTTVAVTVAISVVSVMGLGLALELRSIKRGRESVG